MKQFYDIEIKLLPWQVESYGGKVLGVQVEESMFSDLT